MPEVASALRSGLALQSKAVDQAGATLKIAEGLVGAYSQLKVRVDAQEATIRRIVQSFNTALSRGR